MASSVFLSRLDQTREQTGAHNGLFRRHRIGQHFGLQTDALIQYRFNLRVDKAVGHDLLKTKPGQALAQLALTVSLQIHLRQGQTHRWLSDRNVVVPINSAHFLDQIRFYGDIKTMRGSDNLPLDATVR